MAIIGAQSAFLMNRLNFYDVTFGAYDSEFSDSVYLSSGGYTYEDMYNVYWYDRGMRVSSYLARIIHDPLRLVDCLPPFSAEANC